MIRSTLCAAATLLLAAPVLAQDAPPPSADLDGAGVILQAAQRFDADSHVIVLIRQVADEAAIPAGEALAARFDATLEASVPLPSVDETCYVIRVPEGADPVALGEAVAAEADVLAAYPVQTFTVEQSRAAEPFAPVQDALAAMGVDRLPDAVSGAGATVALVDTAVAADHPDLADQEIRRFDFVRDRTDDAGDAAGERHGTAMAGLIVADAANGVGMAGVAPAAALLALRGCWEEDGPGGGTGRCNTLTLGLALDRAVTERADVINLSLSGPSDALLANIVAAAVETGATVVAAGGPGREEGFPAALPGVIAATDVPAAGAILAPGTEVLSTVPGGAWDFFSGASVASAHVAGIAALLRSTAPDAEAEAVRVALTTVADEGIDGCAALAALADGVASVCR